MSLTDRLKKAITEKKLSQQQLTQNDNVHYTKVGRHGQGDAKPSADVLNRLANTLEVSPDFLMNRTLDDKAQGAPAYQELLSRFTRIENLAEDCRGLQKEILDAFIIKKKLQQPLAYS